MSGKRVTFFRRVSALWLVVAALILMLIVRGHFYRDCLKFRWSNDRRYYELANEGTYISISISEWTEAISFNEMGLDVYSEKRTGPAFHKIADHEVHAFFDLVGCRTFSNRRFFGNLWTNVFAYSTWHLLVACLLVSIILRLCIFRRFCMSHAFAVLPSR